MTAKKLRVKIKIPMPEEIAMKEAHEKFAGEIKESLERSKHGKYLKYYRVDTHISSLGNKFARLILGDDEGNWFYSPINIAEIRKIAKIVAKITGEIF